MYQEIRKMLEDEREELIKDILKTKNVTNREHDIGDEIDNSVEDQARELVLLLQDRERDKLELINDALQRMDEGEYGICEECDEQIPIKRLTVLPFARLCVGCQEELERHQGPVSVDRADSNSRLLAGMEDG